MILVLTPRLGNAALNVPHFQVILSKLPLFICLTHVMQEDVVLERVGDKPLGVGILSTVLNPVLLLRKLEKLLHWDCLS